MSGNIPREDSDLPEQLPENDPSQSPKRQRIEEIFEKVEMMAMHKQFPSGMNVNAFNDNQKQQLLELAKTNEDNAFKFFVKKLESKERLKLAQINAGSYEYKTSRITTVIVCLALLGVTILILFKANDLFVHWLTFIGGLLGGGFGGYGYGKAKVLEKAAHNNEKKD